MPNQRFSSLWYSVLSSVLLVLATSFANLWPLVWIALVPFFLNFFALHSVRKIILSTLIVGVPYSIAVGEPLFRLSGTWWVSNSEESLASLHTFEYAAVILLLISFAAAFYLIPMLIVSKIKQVVVLPILLAFLVALTEFVRSIVLLGYSWGALGYLLIDARYVKHIASIVGVYGLTFMIVLYSAWAAILITRYTMSEGNMRSRLHAVFFRDRCAYETIALVLFLVAVLLFGMYRDTHTTSARLNLRVAVIASNIPTLKSLNEDAYHTYRSMFVTALEKNPDIILTPENVFPYIVIDEEGYTFAKYQSNYLPNSQALYEDFLALTKAYPKTTFAVALHSEKNHLFYNSILLYRNGEVISVYHKRHPVPFTEYAPLGLPLPIFEVFAKGDEMQDFHLDSLLLAGAICAEIDVIPFSTHGAKLILAPANDSVLVSKGIASLHQRIARMRALETGAYLLRSSKGGISSIIDPYGNAIATMSEENGVLFADIP